MSVSVLFARSDSCYKSLPDVDVWDKERNALTWSGGNPVVAHPPCRAWGRLRKFSNHPPGEKDLARFAVRMVQKYGGVLEHPAGSTLWKDQNLPSPGLVDIHGGWTLAAPQLWWGHKAEKKTWFYIVGCDLKDIPQIPFKLNYATHVIETRKKGFRRPSITKAEREHTPVKLALWLCDLAKRCDQKQRVIS